MKTQMNIVAIGLVGLLSTALPLAAQDSLPFPEPPSASWE